MPQTFQEVVTSPNAPYWNEAINSELESILENNTFEMIDLPLGSKPIGSKWIFKRKLKANDTIDKYKSSLIG